ncbi:hemin uptake protein HemP [Hyphomicrobium sp. B1]|uniref:hemin uptake protein HemP n=1 Tax=Hyphomicrobium sp. B1 TaxID=3075651 RepID=UPI003C2E44D8
MPSKKPFAGSVLQQGEPGVETCLPAPEGHHRDASEPSIRYRVDELLKGGREAVLIHREQAYRLRITSTGKLILTK